MSARRPPDWLLAWAPVIEFMRRVRSIPVNTRATSWWRGVAENAEAGGSPYSQHLLGLAADFPRIDGLLAAAGEAQLVAIDEPRKNHVHVQLYTAGQLNRIIDRVRPYIP